MENSFLCVLPAPSHHTVSFCHLCDSGTSLPNKLSMDSELLGVLVHCPPHSSSVLPLLEATVQLRILGGCPHIPLAPHKMHLCYVTVCEIHEPCGEGGMYFSHSSHFLLLSDFCIYYLLCSKVVFCNFHPYSILNHNFPRIRFMILKRRYTTFIVN